MDKLIFPLTHLLATPAHHGVLIDRKRFVGDYKVLIDTGNLAVAFAQGAGSERIVEIEHEVGRLGESDAVALEFLGKEMCNHTIGAPHLHSTLVAALEKGSLDRVEEARTHLLAERHAHAVDEQRVAREVGHRHAIGDIDKISVVLEA